MNRTPLFVSLGAAMLLSGCAGGLAGPLLSVVGIGGTTALSMNKVQQCKQISIDAEKKGLSLREENRLLREKGCSTS